MKTIILDDETIEMKPCVATIGFFDGVHRGHQFLIKHVVEEARESGMASAVITFDRHPRQVLHSDFIPLLLSTIESKRLLLSKTEIDNCVMLHFDEQMALLSAHDFMEKILRDRLNVKKLFIGYDNRFGHNRAEGFDDYVRFGRELGIEVIRSQSFVLNGINVSSSVIRKYIATGEVEMANQYLGYPYTIYGKVVDGFREGRKLGFPTANLDTDGYGQMIPAPGVYAVKTRLQQSVEMKRAMMNIGTRPTFGGDRLSLETHILNFDGDIYGKTLFVSFMHRLREEQKFDDVKQLIQQLKEDQKMVDEQFDKEMEE